MVLGRTRKRSASNENSELHVQVECEFRQIGTGQKEEYAVYNRAFCVEAAIVTLRIFLPLRERPHEGSDTWNQT